MTGLGAAPAIASPANPRVKAWSRLRDRRERDRTGLTLVDGLREVGRALEAGATFQEVVVGPRAETADEGRALVGRLRAARVPIVRVAAPVQDRLAFGERSEGVVAIVRVPSLALADLALPPDPLVVVLDGVEKPGNVGAVLRSADGAGADAVIVADPRTDLFNPNAIRASLGTIFCVRLAQGSSQEVLAWCVGQGLRLLAARVDATQTYTEADLCGPLAIVLGSEAEGLGAPWRSAFTTPVRLPMHGLADSLNVSVAAAVLLYEARRQRDAAVPGIAER